jgi:photosystem II stability/assembly factor-like uncharacterized protein
MRLYYSILAQLIISIIFSCILSGQVSLQNMEWRGIGPASPGGRIVDIEAVEKDFKQVFIATASGGVWKSNNAGTTWEPIFDRYATASIGDIALFQANPKIIWVGTGEANNRNSVSWGNGMYKSTDGGKNFDHVGLTNTQQIARVLTHPSNPLIAYVAAIGPLWSDTAGDRGLFQTKDGGQTWTKLTTGLPVHPGSGCTDIVMDSKNPSILYAAFYERLRKPYIFNSGGNHGGIFKSTDGGKNWVKLTQGLPDGPTGRIGLAAYRKDPRILIALVEAEPSKDLSKKGSGLYRSEDGGKSWKYINTYNNRPFYYSQVAINPQDNQKVYVMTTRFMVSSDGGKTLKDGSQDQEVHGDFHAIWLDPYQQDRYYLGADKGVSLTHDHGQAFQLFDNLPIAQYYRIGVDMQEPYTIYGGLQDNGFFATASFSRDVRGILNDASWKVHWGDGMYGAVNPYNWREVYTGSENGSYNRYDPLTHKLTDIQPKPATILNYGKINPVPTIPGTPVFRYNWSAPFVLSPLDPKTVFLGSNYLFQSKNGGQTWEIISPDLTTNDSKKIAAGNNGGITPDNTGAEDHCTIFTISPSPIDAGLIWLGTDDGNVQLTLDEGKNWRNVRNNFPNVPAFTWVTQVEASHFDPAVAYVAFDGHRDNVFKPFVFKTMDFGKTWIDIASNLPENEVIRVIREDPKNKSLLFLGTETGVWYSLNAGKEWHRLNPGMPTVSVYDLVIHPRENDLIAATHGRSLFILDDISPLQQLTPTIAAGKAWLFHQKPATLWANKSRGAQRGHFWFAGKNPANIKPISSLPRAVFENGALIHFYLKDTSEPASIQIKDQSGTLTTTLPVENKPGIQRIRWNLKFDKKEALPGFYQVTLKVGQESYHSSLEVKVDPLHLTGKTN